MAVVLTFARLFDTYIFHNNLVDKLIGVWARQIDSEVTYTNEVTYTSEVFIIRECDLEMSLLHHILCLFGNNQ